MVPGAAAPGAASLGASPPRRTPLRSGAAAVPILELLGEELSAAVDLAQVNLGAALQAAVRARRARTPLAAARAWERTARQLRAAGRRIAAGELAALERARAAVLAAPASARAPAPPTPTRAAGELRPGGAPRRSR